MRKGIFRTIKTLKSYRIRPIRSPLWGHEQASLTVATDGIRVKRILICTRLYRRSLA
jgi:hypothetical protein